MSDLIERLRVATEANAHPPSVRIRLHTTDRGTRGHCSGSGLLTIPVLVSGVGAWARSQCSRCDWYAGVLPGAVLHGHERVWRDSRGNLEGYRDG